MDTTKEARYLRILFTADYKYRWVKISEILINDGEYIPTINDPTYISDPIELEGFAPRNINDGDLTTVYKPNTNNDKIKSGSLTYRLSEKTDVKKINIVQGGNSISNAKVMVRTGYNEYGEAIWNELGILNKSLTELVNSKYDNIFEIRIDWQGIAPTIYEIVTINDYNVPDITDLEELVASSNKYVEENYTKASYGKFIEALEKAKDILNDLASVSQDDIDNAKLNLINSITELVNIKDLVDVINRANSIIESNVEYTEETIQALKEMLDNAKKVLANEVSTQDEVNKALEDLNKAIDNLEVKEEPAKPSKPSNPSGDNADGETVKTGDTQGSKVLLFASIAIIAGIACVYFRKKKTVK
ncbi:coiled-coil domain-containing protein [Clostridium paraputrificum]|uniref:coiled-coil domain-containing protein n=1 Tax=Clostridium paraputrificum TaxID=29363 RepID=UPI000C07C95A|nr:FIVAR domain-containing protein [Clostridium paraputrificum]